MDDPLRRRRRRLGVQQCLGRERRAVYSTHNGGLSWTLSILPGTIGSSPGIEALAATGGSVYAVVFDPANDDFAIFASPVNKDAWNPSPTHLLSGRDPSEFQSSSTEQRGGSLTTTALSSEVPFLPTALGRHGFRHASRLVATAMATWRVPARRIWSSSPPSEYADSPSSAALFHSTNGGMSFQKLLSSPPASASDLASPEPGTFFFQANPGVITASFDNGGTWQTVATFSSTNSSGETYPSSIDFVSPVRGYAMTSAGALLTTTDGGHSWAPQGFMK